MGRNADKQRAGWLDDTRAQGFERRDWPRVQKLAAGSVALMAAGVLAERRPEAAGLAVLGYISAGVVGGVMLAHFLDDRLFVEKPPA